MQKKKIITLLLGAFLLLLLGTTNVQATLKLNHLEFDVYLNDDGSMEVTETWDINISETNTLYKTIHIDKNKYDSITNFSVKEITENQKNYLKKSYNWQYHLPKNYYFGGINEDGKYEISWGVGLDNSSDTRKYEINYTVLGAVHKYEDCNELYWQFIGDEFEIPAEKITGTIKLPNYVTEKEDIKVWGHTEDLNGEIFAINGDTIKFELEKYRAKHFVEIRMAMPTYLFGNIIDTNFGNRLEEIIKEETKWANEANALREKKQRTAKAILGTEIVVLGVLLIFFISKILKYFKKLKEIQKIKPSIELEYYRDLPDDTATPSEAMFLLNKYIDVSKAFSATLLNLALKKYIELKQQEKDVYIKILNENLEELKSDEQEIMQLLLKVKNAEHYTDFTMKQVEKYVRKFPSSFIRIEEKFKTSSKETSEEKGKFNQKTEKKGIKFMIINSLYFVSILIIPFLMVIPIVLVSEFYAVKTAVGIIIMAIGFCIILSLIINCILTVLLAKRYNGFTQKGIDEKEKWKAFKKYMLDFSLLNEKEVPHLILWERFLVFATAFGIAEKVIKQLKVKYPELNNPDTTSNMIILGTLYHGGNFNADFISSINSSSSHMYSSYSSSTGGGGGFSGGGGGRWPEEDGGGGR